MEASQIRRPVVAAMGACRRPQGATLSAAAHRRRRQALEEDTSGSTLEVDLAASRLWGHRLSHEEGTRGYPRAPPSRRPQAWPRDREILIQEGWLIAWAVPAHRIRQHQATCEVEMTWRICPGLKVCGMFQVCGHRPFRTWRPEVTWARSQAGQPWAPSGASRTRGCTPAVLDRVEQGQATIDLHISANCPVPRKTRV